MSPSSSYPFTPFSHSFFFPCTPTLSQHCAISFPSHCERTVSTAPITADSGSDSTEDEDSEEDSEEGDQEGSEEEREEEEESEEEEEEECDWEEGDQTDSNDNRDGIPRPQKSGDAISESHRVQLTALVSELIKTKANHPVTIFATGIVVRTYVRVK